MNFDVITLFPDIIKNYCSYSIVGRACSQEKINVNTINPRDFTHDSYKKVDDNPYGGGAGMVLMCQPIYDAFESIQKQTDSISIMFTPQGRPYNQQLAEELSTKNQIVMLCGHYEGYDERIRKIPEIIEVSLGDYVLTGGELGALCIIDSVTRLLPGTLGKDESAHEDSFADGLLEYPHYTRPYNFRDMTVPDILLSGNHAEIAKWRKKQAIIRTKEKRPDLFQKYLQKNHTKEEKKLLKELEEQWI